MLPQIVISSLPFLSNAPAMNLYVASYAGEITSLSLFQNPDSSYSLTRTSSLDTSTHTPSWLTLDRQNNVLYMIDEAVGAPNGTVVSYRTSSTGKLTEIERLEDIGGGVYATFYSSSSAIAVPHYIGSTLQTYDITSSGHLTPLQTFTYSLPKPGPVPNRQDAPHPHQTLLDPSQQYLLVPDLGADLVRIYFIDQSTRKLTARAPLKAQAGSGPRHGAFSIDPISGHYIFYLVAELTSTVTAYRMSYTANLGGLSFDQIGVYSTLAPGQPMPSTTTGESTGVAAEIAVSPDGSTVIISNRRDMTFNNTTPASDSITSFSISKTDGTLTLTQAFPAGGSYPRQFALNRAGDLLAVGLQQTGSVAILKRDVTSGAIQDEVARIEIECGEVVCVVWDE